MPRYTAEALTEMLRVVAADDAEGGERSLRLYVAVAIRLGVDVRMVRDYIMRLASG